jgi:hypothetical protein
MTKTESKNDTRVKHPRSCSIPAQLVNKLNKIGFQHDGAIERSTTLIFYPYTTRDTSLATLTNASASMGKVEAAY